MKTVQMATRRQTPLNCVNRRGFTLVEMMIVVVIVGVLASIAAPGAYRYMKSNRLLTNSDRLVADLQYARMRSISTSKILRFASTRAGYQIVEPQTGAVIRQKVFPDGMNFALNQTADFYPWGMASATVFNISNGANSQQINLLPTGIVEVQ